ncbi:hypothetical protein K6V92_10405 [Cupriavidus respiraculi]|uniref:hypothetical protein n=1 Tax=Cupriavidus respiraculi TaxID=195930 RepID=UPI001C93E63C|nr:hypothetical protein [Cupriavidus respiraculi]MBY4947029.1 hypothetical protein [Cupriavidus respiraculi]
MNQLEIRMFAPYVEPKRKADGEVEAMTFEQALTEALEIGLRRFDRKTLARLCNIHYPHFADLIAGRRPFPAVKLSAFCMLCGCDYPKQWLAIQERKEAEAYKAASQEAVFEYLQRAMKAA